MKSIPADFDLAELVGGALAQVRIDQHQAQLLFDAGQIAVEGTLRLQAKDGAAVPLFDGQWKTSQGLEQLVGQLVTSWSRKNSHAFQITFSSGTALIIESEDSPYEDVVVTLGKENKMWVL